MVSSSSGDRFSELISAPKNINKTESNVSTTSTIRHQVIDERKRKSMKHISSSGRVPEIKKFKYPTEVQYGPEEGKTHLTDLSNFILIFVFYQAKYSAKVQHS